MKTEVLDSKQASSTLHLRGIPVLMAVVLIYIAFEFVNQLSKVPNFVDTASIASILSDAMGFATILIPVLLLYGIARRKKWARNLTLAWFGWEILSGVSILFLSFMVKHFLPASPKLLVEFTFELFVLVYIWRAIDFFERQTPATGP